MNRISSALARPLAGLLLAAALLPGPARAVDPAPPAFLGAIAGAQALAWVRAHNRPTLARLQSDPRYPALFREALAVAQSRDRIPAPELIGGMVYNFWQDPGHVRGIWRRASLASYRAAHPAWTTVLDLDALSRAEHANWVWREPVCDLPADRRCLLLLSDGGEDAVTVREFDLETGRFVTGGFVLPRSKQEVAWLDDDTLMVGRDWGSENGRPTLTPSSYPFIIKRLRRGEPVERAAEMFRGQPTDMTVTPLRLVDGDGHRLALLSRALSFFEFEVRMVTPDGLRVLGLPRKVALQGLVAGRLVARVDQDWTPRGGPAVTAGSLVSLDPERPDAPPRVIFQPGPTQALDTVMVTKHHVVAALYDDVRGQAWSFAPAAGGWTRRRLPLPDDVSVDVAASSVRGEDVMLDVTGFLTPSQLWLADAAGGTAAAIKSMAPEFDARPYVVDQLAVASRDGTRIPYFVVRRRGMATNGRNPVLLYGYGGFDVPMTPSYSGALGRLWLDRGGVYVLANIRGGGEFGPAWHDAGLQTHRQRVFDDFAAVGADIVRRGITAPARLGIRGGSNGGLLMGVELTQHPEMWRAVVIDVPLLDMMNFETMSAGASWVGEYGSVSVPDQRAFLQAISPLQNLRPGVRYPEPFIFTTTKDDRVGPVHARRFAARMEQLGLPFLYFEQVEGGHAAGANLREKATEQALEFTYLSRKLMP